ncbi:uncharacterized oxidoreductase TM_0325-like [Sitodiplosis mosellana]|uniref:uncharacterized oxidoreductase TM_0325-like n=1 Tax=Sitodiplosis mosellana TaxID=263140 RepID=UPI0024451DBE|nr:uncharacterized oxidoreductase TM_0325-like [Sitodiplosis mosellana]
MSFEGKTVLVVGAEFAIGTLAAEYFGKEKAKLALVSSNSQNKFDNVLENIEESGVKTDVFVIIGDVTKDSKCIIDKTIDKFGRLDILFISASFIRPASIENFNIRDFDAMMTQNVRSSFELTHFAVPHLIESKGNIIIDSSTALGLIPVENWIFCCISKAALQQFTKCAAIELKDHGVRMNCISAQNIDVDFHSFIDIDRDKEEVDYENFLEQNDIKGPMNERNGQKIDCVSAIAFLANDNETFFITGLVVPVYSNADCGAISAKIL